MAESEILLTRTTRRHADGTRSARPTAFEELEASESKRKTAAVLRGIEAQKVPLTTIGSALEGSGLGCLAQCGPRDGDPLQDLGRVGNWVAPLCRGGGIVRRVERGAEPTTAGRSGEGGDQDQDLYKAMAGWSPSDLH